MLQGYKQEKDCKDMKYLVLEQMAGFKVHKLSSVLQFSLLKCGLFFFFFLFFSVAIAFGLIKGIVSVDKTSLLEKFVSGKVCLFLVCRSTKTQRTNKLKTKPISQANAAFQADCLAFWNLGRPSSSLCYSQQERSSETFQFLLCLWTDGVSVRCEIR